jgi:replicative DNA helicase
MKTDISTYDFDIEVQILGAILLYSDCFSLVSDSLNSEKFVDIRNRHIYQSIERLHLANVQIDIISVIQDLKQHKLLDDIGTPYIASLTNKVSNTSNIEQWVFILNDLYMVRQFKELAVKIVGMCDTESAHSIYDSFAESMSKVMSNGYKKDTKHISIPVKEGYDSVHHRMKQSVDISGYSTGIKSVDRILGGHQNSDLLYLAARPSMGKTAFALTTCLNIALQNIPVAFFSLEMSSVQLVYRLNSMLSKISAEKLMKYKLTGDEYKDFTIASEKLNTLPIYIDDTAGITISDLTSKIKRLVQKQMVKVVFVDYVQLLTFSKGKTGLSREQELSAISRQLKVIAKECDIPMIVLSQLSRSLESRSDKRPMLSDLRESGSLEQDADIVSFLFRPEYYGIERTAEGGSTSGMAEYIVAKQRNGATGIVPIYFNKTNMQFVSEQQNQNEFF